ncbi:MAG TPA: universal stress protein [Pyrinomonadaceae bacterium]
MKILIAYDGSPCAEAALDDLRRAGLPAAAEAYVISVTEVWLPPPPPSVYEVVEEATTAHTPAELQMEYVKESPSVEEARLLAAGARNRLLDNFPGWVVRAEGRYGSPAREIVRLADEWKPDLVVVGSQGHTALGRLVLGSVSQKVVTEARNSVRVARGRVEVEPKPVRVVVGVDGSPGSEAAVREVAARCWPPGGEARVVVVDDPLVPSPFGQLIPPVTRWVEESNREERAWVQEMADEATSRLRRAELVVSSSVVVGDPKRALVEEAERWGADCIFVGSHGFGNRLERFLLGSVSAAVAARAHCSVEVVRAPKDE